MPLQFLSLYFYNNNIFENKNKNKKYFIFQKNPKIRKLVYNFQKISKNSKSILYFTFSRKKPENPEIFYIFKKIRKFQKYFIKIRKTSKYSLFSENH